MPTITDKAFYAIAKYAHNNGKVFENAITVYDWTESTYYTPVFWVSIVRTDSHIHYMVVYRPTGEYIYDKTVWKRRWL